MSAHLGLPAAKRLVIIDGNAILHRAYHAYPALTNPQGNVVNAVYGFFSMFLTLIHDIQPLYVAVCFDRSKPTHRQALYAGYHAHRPQMSSDFAPQVGMVDTLLEQMGVKVFAVAGYEGDDLVGTLATRAVNEYQGIEVIIVTGDRDMLQLVNAHVTVLMPLVGITKTVLFDEEAVVRKYGVYPRQFIDYKALIGDSSDGYPGVTGIGPKTASRLLKQYETFENLYKHVGELPEKTGLMLATDAEQAALAKQLAAIVCDVPIQFDIKKTACTEFDMVSLREGFIRHNFKSLIDRLDKWYPPPLPQQKTVKEKPEKQLVLLEE